MSTWASKAQTIFKKGVDISQLLLSLSPILSLPLWYSRSILPL